MAKEFTPEDKAKMDAAAQTARVELDKLLAGKCTVKDILKWHTTYTPTAGHKRLGRIMNELAKLAAGK